MRYYKILTDNRPAVIGIGGGGVEITEAEYSHIKSNIDNAIRATLSRTINTSGTTLVTLLSIFIFGGETIRGFVFALILGVVIGTYSSVFIATPIAYDLQRKNE